MAYKIESPMEPPEKSKSLCSCLWCFVIWLFPVSLALAIALFFSPNDRISRINQSGFVVVFRGRFNIREEEYNKTGMAVIDELAVSAFIENKEYLLNKEVYAKAGSNIMKDQCNKEEEHGCADYESIYYTTSIPMPASSFEIILSDAVHMDSYNETVQLMKGKQYLQRICYRIGDAKASVLDVPPSWDLLTKNPEAGCDYGNNWSPLYYGKTKPENVTVEARYYMDPYISASALTRGCSEREGNSNCFGPSHKEMSNFGLYGIIAAGSVTAIELITFLSMCICCRDKLSCFGKDADD